MANLGDNDCRSIDNITPNNRTDNYACGAWTRSHSIPGDESRIDTFSVMRTDLGNKLKDLLEEEINSSDSEATIKAKTLYKSCVDETTIDKRGPEPLLALLESKFGGWPLLGPRSSSNSSSSLSGELANQEAQTNVNEISPSDWVKLMAILRTYNNEIIIGQTVGSHEQNSTLHAIRLYPAGLGLPSADYYNSSSRQFKAYEKYLLNVARLLGANNTNLVQDVADLLDFETGLANISKPFERQGGATYHRMTIAKLQKYTPAIDWDTYFRYSFPDVAINSTEQVGLYGLDFFMDIAQLINSTPNKKTVINYLLWRFVMNRVNNLGKEFADKQHEYAAEISGAKNQAPRAKVCVDYVNGNMGMAVSSLYVKKHFDSGSKQQAEIMIANIRQAFLDILHEVDWMDSETRQEAIVKAKSMLQHIGFPTWIIEPATLDQEYMHLNFTANSYFENVIQLIQSFAKESREKLRHPSERDKWTVAPSIINAHYLRTKNLMSFPAGILQPPIYHTRYPKSLNYGGIGSIIGHEITHGFDNDGRHHDYQGNQRLWWHPNTVDRFIIRSQCMVRQYDDYSVEIRGENISVSGIRTLGENIADNGGLKEAFMAYRKYEQENGPEDLFPNVNLTHHQMFFIKFAQNWCQNMTPQSMMNALKTWRHPLGKFR